MRRSLASCFAVLVASILLCFPVLADTEPDPSALHRELAAAKIRAAGAERAVPADKAASLAQLNYDVSYYDLDITLNTVTQQVSGRVLMQATSLIDALTQFDVDLYLAMTTDSVHMSGSPVVFTHLGSEIFITPPSPLDSGDTFSVTMYYHGPPASGGFGAFGFNIHGSPSTPIIWSLSEPYYARNWWPCKDTPSDKADSVDIHITCPSNLFAASNGVLVSEVDLGNGTTTYNWRHRHPIVTYLVSLSVTNYVQLDYEYVHNQGLDTMPVHFWVYPERVTDAQNAYPEVVQMLGAFDQYYGPYPFLDEKYAISHFPWGGGMEHQTNTSQTYASYSRNLTSHELSHQWWGDMITCRDWRHIWLNEGFASYSEAQYVEWLSGAGAYRSYMNSMAYKGGGTVIVDDTTSVGRIFHSGLSYDKGAWVVHMLRGVLGDSLFYASLAEYRSQFAGLSATTEDFQAVCEQVSGLDLSEFFADWLYGTYYPRYIYSYYTVPLGLQTLARVRLEQIQGSAPQVFDMPVDFSFTNGASSHSLRVQNTARLEWFDVILPFNPTNLELDPLGWILKDRYVGVAVITDSLKQASRDELYFDTLDAVRGAPPYTWTVPSPGDLPPGLVVSPAGVVSGAPLNTATYTFTVRVEDSGVITSSMERDVTLVVGLPSRPEGDLNDDGQVTSADIVFLVNYVFKSGPPPLPLSYGDVNLSCSITAADIIYLVDYVFKSGPAPLGSCVP